MDEALWAADRKGEGVLKALITEPTFQLEAKFRDPIMVQNRLSIIVASNSDWAVPAGVGDRRWFVLNVADAYAGTGHRAYWDALYDEIEKGGAAAMLHDLLAMDLSKFDVRAIPHSAAKAQQQVHSLHGTNAWLYHVLQEGSIKAKGYRRDGQPIADYRWEATGVTITTAKAYESYLDFSAQQREWKPEIKDLWSKNVQKALRSQIKETRPFIDRRRERSYEFAPLADCRREFANHVGAPDLEWDDPDEVWQQKNKPRLSKAIPNLTDPECKPGSENQSDRP